MDIIIDTSESKPVFAQLVQQIKNAVLAGSLTSGQQLPSIRQLATDLGINHNTVAKAYRLLERDSVIETGGYRGTFIHKEAEANCSVDLNEWVREKVSESIAIFREAGLTDSEIRIAYSNELSNKTN